MAKSTAFSRREFLRTGVTAGAALVVGFRLSASAFTGQATEQEKKTPNPFDAWVSITPDNRVTLILGKSEMGQGIMTALPMILAEELCVDWKNVKVEQAPTNPKIYDLGTGGSGSVAGSWLPLRRAGAAAREMLIAAAAQKWEVGVDTCKAQDGQVVHGNPKRYLSYGELVETAAKLPIPNFNTVPLKNANDFTLVGHATRRYEVRDKATGAATFGIDSRVPGMVYAVVARCPVFGGKVVSFDAAKAKAVPGVRDVIAFETSGRGASTTGGIAVLAVNSWAAMQGRNALEVKWDFGPASKESSAGLHEQFLANAAKPGKIVRDDGDADSVLASSAKKIEAAYEFPFCPSCLHGADELHRAHPARRSGSMGADAGTAVGARRDRGSGQVAAGKSDRPHNADGRWIWAPLPGGFCDGSRAGGQGRGETGDGSVDPRRRHAARFLSARLLPQDAGRAGCERGSGGELY